MNLLEAISIPLYLSRIGSPRDIFKNCLPTPVAEDYLEKTTAGTIQYREQRKMLGPTYRNGVQTPKKRLTAEQALEFPWFNNW